MTILLDTHVFLWWITNDRRISSVAEGLISDKNNDLLLSAASAWEIAIKAQLGKLPLPDDPEVFIPQQMAINRVRSLPVSTDHALHVSKLPSHHRDPFDRLLIAQAKVENIPLLSDDSLIKLYPIQVLW